MTHYDTLQVSRSASQEVIDASWKALMRLHHTDLPSGDEEYARQLNEAHRVLSDPKRREAYDRTLRPQAAAPINVSSSASAYPPAYPDVRMPRITIEELYGEVVKAVDLPSVLQSALEEASKNVLGRIIRENPLVGQILDAAQAKAKKRK